MIFDGPIVAITDEIDLLLMAIYKNEGLLCSLEIKALEEFKKATLETLLAAQIGLVDLAWIGFQTWCRKKSTSELKSY